MSGVHAGFPLPDVSWEPAAPFWAGAARGELVVPRCPSCDVWRWYPHGHPHPLTWERVSGRATLFSWVVVTHPFLPAFADLVPFVTGLVAIDDAPGVRLATRIVDAEPASLDFDQPLEVVFRPLSFPGVDGTVPAPLFRPA